MQYQIWREKNRFIESGISSETPLGLWQDRKLLSSWILPLSTMQQLAFGYFSPIFHLSCLISKFLCLCSATSLPTIICFTQICPAFHSLFLLIQRPMWGCSPRGQHYKTSLHLSHTMICTSQYFSGHFNFYLIWRICKTSNI